MGFSWVAEVIINHYPMKLTESNFMDHENTMKG